MEDCKEHWQVEWREKRDWQAIADALNRLSRDVRIEPHECAPYLIATLRENGQEIHVLEKDALFLAQMANRYMIADHECRKRTAELGQAMAVRDEEKGRFEVQLSSLLNEEPAKDLEAAIKRRTGEEL